MADAADESKADSSESGFFSSLSLPSYRTLWLSSSGNFFAQQMQIVAKGYLAYVIGNSATALGATNLMFGGSMLLLALFGGAFADRVNKRNLVVASQVLSSLSALVIASLVVAGRIELWHMFAASVVQGIVMSFNMPARQAMVPEVVGKRRLTNALALNAIGANMSRIFAPSLAGLILGISFMGPAGAYYIISGLFVLIALVTFKLPSFPPSPNASKEPLLASVGGGLKFMRQSPYLIALLGMAFIPVTLGMPYQALLPAYNDRALHGGPEVLGLLYMAVGAGSLLGSFAVASAKTMAGKSWLQLGGGLFFGLSLASFALTSDFRLAMVLLVLTGACSQVYMTVNNTFILTSTPREYYGRVMSIYQLTFAVMPLVTFPVSVAADAIGITTTFAICGSLMAAVMLLVILFNPGGARGGPRIEGEPTVAPNLAVGD